MVRYTQFSVPGCDRPWREIVRETARDAAEIVQDAGLGPFEILSEPSQRFLDDVVDEFAAVLLETDRLSEDELQAEIDDLVERMTPFHDFETIEIVRDFHLYRGNIVFLPPLQDGVYRWYEVLRAAVKELAESIVTVLLEEFSTRQAERNAALLATTPSNTARDLAQRLVLALDDFVTERAEALAIAAATWILDRTSATGADIALALLFDGRSLEEATTAASACIPRVSEDDRLTPGTV